MLIVFDPLHNLFNHLLLDIWFATFVHGNNDAINIPVPKSLQSYTDRTVGTFYILLDQRKYTFYFWLLTNCPPKRLQSIPWLTIYGSTWFHLLCHSFLMNEKWHLWFIYFIKYCDAFICIVLIISVIKDVFIWFYFFFCALYFLCFLVWHKNSIY